MINMSNYRIGIIGGSGLYQIEAFTSQRWIEVKTPFGAPSDQFLAGQFAGMVHFEGDWELTAPIPLSLVCFRYAPAGATEDDLARINAAIMERVNANGKAYLSHTKLNGKYTLRLAIGNIRTDRPHIEQVWRELREAATLVR